MATDDPPGPPDRPRKEARWIYFAMGAWSERVLAGLKDWMSQHNAVIMAVLCLVIGAKLIGDAISTHTT